MLAPARRYWDARGGWDEEFTEFDGPPPGYVCLPCRLPCRNGERGPCTCGPELPDLTDCDCGARSPAGEPCIGCGEVLL